MSQPGVSDSEASPEVFLTRRELRAQREALPALSPATAQFLAPKPEPVVVPAAKPRRRFSVAPAKPVGRFPRKRRHPVKIAIAVLAIPAIFLTAALPAYAFTPRAAGDLTSATHSSGNKIVQGLTVAAAATAVTVSRDGFAATTKEQLAAQALAAKKALAAQQAATARAASAAFAVYGVRAEGDDYPWYNMPTESQGGGLSPLSYYYRECVDFVAWRLNRDAGSTGSSWRWTWNSLTPGGGNASAWASAWSNHGWTTSKTPVVGAVAWFNYNHVAYVQSVGGDGSVVLEEYNWMGSHAYHKRTVSPSDVALFLYPPA